MRILYFADIRFPLERANGIQTMETLKGVEFDTILPGHGRAMNGKAALNHSEDMSKHNFFDHDSPVKGRRSFGDRAAEAGTTASAHTTAAITMHFIALSSAYPRWHSDTVDS